MRPSFIGIGAQKCASSWLYQMLKEHPQVAVSEKKELNFFSYCYENGFRWYESQFEDRPGVLQAGEVSPSYLHEPGVVERARAYSADLRIVVSLRDPVERALSQHRHMVREGLVPPGDLSFERALETNPTYVEQGLYFKHLSLWAAAFGRQRIHAVLMDDIKRDNAGVVQELYTFLGVNTDYRPQTLDERRNPSYVIRRPGMHRAVRMAQGALEGVGARAVWKALGDSGLRKAYRAVNRADSSLVIPEPRPETIQRLRDRFQEDVDRLTGLLGRDLAVWRSPDEILS